MFGRLFSRKKNVLKPKSSKQVAKVLKYIVLKTKAGQILHAYPVGVVDHYFGKVSVITMKLKGALKLGELIFIRGKRSKLFQKIESMQHSHKSITQARIGDEIGIQVRGEVRVGDVVYRCVAHS